MNAECLPDIFKPQVVPYELRATDILQRKRHTTTHGLRSYSNLGTRLNTHLCHIDYIVLKEIIEHWIGPNLDDGFNYV